jgi:hypothetical protein
MTDEQLFHHSITLDREDQSSYLAKACTDDDQERRVQALLAAHSATDSLLDTASASGSLHETTKNESSLPQSIGDFQILRELGRGGMGVVYEARQKSLKRRVALKVLSSGLGLSSKAILRFRREAEAAGKLHHTNIVPIYTTGEDKGIHYYAMELVDGPSLDQVIKGLKREQCASSSDGDGLQITALQAAARGNDGRQVVPCGVQANGKEIGRLENHESDQADRASAKASSSISTATGSSYFDQVATMMADVADALDHAHEHGVIHRDVKPSNLLLGPDGQFILYDHRSKSTDGKFANDYAEKIRSKRQELQGAVDELIQRLDTQYKTASNSSTQVFVQAHAIFTALEFLDPSKLEETAERWRTIGVPLNEFATQRMTLHFLVKGEYEQAQIWFDLARSKNLEQSRFLQTSILLANPRRQLTAAELKNQTKKMFEERLTLGKTGFISFDALLAYLLGDDQALAHLADDDIVRDIHGGGMCSALEEYLATEDRPQIDQDELIERCKSPHESNYALMNAYFTLGVEALVNGDDAIAKVYFESCIACRQYTFHVYCLSQFMLSHESQWDLWRRLREESLREESLREDIER